MLYFPKAKICIVTSNLHVGGGVQVAASFLRELTHYVEFTRSADALVSTEVHRSVLQLGLDPSVFHSYSVIDVYGIRQAFGTFAQRLAQYKVVFTVFGPLYAYRHPYASIVGFAQAFVAYPKSEAYFQIPITRRILIRAKFRLQSFFFRRSNHLIVEAPHVRNQLTKMGWRMPIDVVPNCLNGIYEDQGRWMPVEVPGSANIKLGIVCRDYLHKNLGMLPVVKKLLNDQYGLIVDFYVTLTGNEWKARDATFRQSMINVGSLTVAQCPSFYRQMNGVIFPSLLECFSATPLEAMYMQLPLFASDRGYVRDVCGNSAIYFEPTDPNDVAAVIARYFSQSHHDKNPVLIDSQYLDPSLRARRYIEIINQYVNQFN